MSDLEERADKLSGVMERLNRQKTDAIRDTEQLTKQITAALVTGEDVAKLLSTRQIKLALAEAIGPALEEAKKQLAEVQRDIQIEERKLRLEQLKKELQPKQARLDEIEQKLNTYWGPTRQQELVPLLEEQQKLAIAVRMLNREIKELQDPYHHLSEIHDHPGVLDRTPPAWVHSPGETRQGRRDRPV